MDPNGKVALVTGGVSGIGLAYVNELLDNGAKVTACDRNADLADEVMENLHKKFGKDKVIFIQMDVTDDVTFEDAFKKTIAHFGGIDIVINNAGILDEKNWERMIDINLKGVIRGCILSLKYMAKNHGGKGGVVLNTASTAAVDYESPVPMYTATKHGVLGVTRALGDSHHYELSGVRFLVLCPGPTATPFGLNFYDIIFDPDWRKFVNPESYVVGTAESVGKTCLRMIREAENGAVWVSDGEDYCIKIPNLNDIRVKL